MASRVLAVTLLFAEVAMGQTVGNERPTVIDATQAARQPAPGSVTPGSIAWSADGRSVSYLKAEGESLARVLWKADRQGENPPAIVARPPAAVTIGEGLSREEELRRERQRQTATGLTQVLRASRGDTRVFPYQGDLYLQRGDGPLAPITKTAAPELDPKLDGAASRIAFVREGELFVLDLASREEIQLTKGAGDGLSHGLAEFIAQEEFDRDTGFWWSPDGSQIAYQETDERHVPLFTITHQGGADPALETHRYPFAGHANAKVRLGVVPAAGGETRWLPFAAPDEDVYLARVDWESPTHLLVQVLSRDQHTLRLNRIDVETGSRAVLIEETSPIWIDLHDDLRVIEGTGEILWSSERSGYRHLELHDRDGKLIRVLTSGEWPIETLSASRGTRGVLAVDAARREVWFSGSRESPLEAHVYRVSLDGGPVTRVTRERGTHRAVVAPDGNGFVDVYSSRSRPPTTTIRDRDGKVQKTLDDASADPRVKELGLEPPQITQFKNREGVTLYGAYYPPKRQAPDAKVPLVVMVYGGPTVQTVADSWTLTADMPAQYLAARGFAVWKCDNRGSSRRGLDFQASIYRNLGDVEVRDQVDGVKFAAASYPEIDAGRVGITGRSYGGYMTLMGLLKAPEVFRAGVSVAPVTDWDGYDTGYTERYMNTPSHNAEGYNSASALAHAGNLRGSLLLVHGLLDENVHFRHSARLTNALIQADKRFETLIFPEERHGTRQEPNRRYLAEKTAEFFERALAKPVDGDR